ncbi:MAG: twin-arginine translocation signal domain-containing protein, partial [Rubrobacteraceae bacterium]
MCKRPSPRSGFREGGENQVMEKHRINVPSVEEFSRPTSRRGFLKALAVAGMGAADGTTVLAGKANAQGGGGDLEIAN